ncbi:MAG: 3-hydroxyacyl-ACP dehydratase FabZ [Synergistaceae bacterium]|nr:3-hydroxyacyl-ACP dehydratase FabZ [Synergistaceae bacterium]MBR0075422.1 3-hydroxyacyl-ACP dehydratase FabZ [Synergistaceae bacterium]MBR0253898.1 3-hydroxyacyl-ACP dehydratase FabZ [Synergistaceae bacterium]MBR0315413.1 3-hydroxyacyl-ACP dehydratase FabZ [Synergistaceae bacterium]
MAELDINEIMKLLKQRPPFLLVDRVTDYDDTHVTGYKNVTINETFFQGHFPGQPVMPGVLILESMGQVASIMVGLKLGKEQESKIAFFAGADKIRFRKPVRPGDKLVTKAELLKARGTSGKAKVTGYVDDEVVAEGEFLFILADSLTEKKEEN